MRHFSPILSTLLFTTLSAAALHAQTAAPAPPPPQDSAQSAPQSASGPDGQMPQHWHHAPNPQRQAHWMAKKLALTPDQQSQLEPILADRDQRMQAIQADTTLAPRDRHQKMKALRDDSQQKISAILTPAQQQQFAQMQQEQQDRHHHGPQGGPDSDPNAVPPQAPPSGN